MNWRKKEEDNEEEFSLDDMDLDITDNPQNGSRPSSIDFIQLLINELDKSEESSSNMLKYYYEELRVIRNRKVMYQHLLDDLNGK